MITYFSRYGYIINAGDPGYPLRPHTNSLAPIVIPDSTNYKVNWISSGGTLIGTTSPHAGTYKIRTRHPKVFQVF